MSPEWAAVVVALLAFVLSVPVAIVGWIQAHGAKLDAKVAKDHADAAKEQADAAKRIADEAQRQTAAAEKAAEAARKQAAAAVEALDWETIPQLQVVATERHREWVIGGRDRYQVATSEWFVVNTGKADAHRLLVRLDFGSDTQISLGPNNITKLEAGSWYRLGLHGVVMPAYEDLIDAGYIPTARLKYDTPTGQPKDETKRVLPREQE